MITFTYQYRLKLNKQQTQEVERILEVCRCVYNFALSERKDYLNRRKSTVNSCSIQSEYIIPADAPYPNYNNNEILPYVCWKRSKFYLKVNKNGTSQECSKCGNHTGKKHLSERIHNCQYCGYTAPRDVVSAEVIRNRGLIAVGHTVNKNAWVDVLTGRAPK